MRSLFAVFSFVALSACVARGEESTRSAEPQSETQSELSQSKCGDAWECWCNTFSTRESCNSAVQGGRHCWWEGASDAASATASLNACHATYE